MLLVVPVASIEQTAPGTRPAAILVREANNNGDAGVRYDQPANRWSVRRLHPKNETA
jgi:hypothetical protein